MFALLIIEHKLWGSYFVPYSVKPKENGLYVPIEMITKETISSYELSEDEKKVFDETEKYSDLNLIRIFSRGDTKVLFYKKCESKVEICDKVKDFIQQYSYKIGKLVSAYNIPTFLGREKTFYSQNRVMTENADIKTIPAFVLTDEDLKYSLHLYDSNETSIDIFGKKITILSNSPCCTVIGQKLVLSDTLEASKLLPFSKKKTIDVPSQMVASYMKSFVKNQIMREDIECDGFSVSKRDIIPVPTLSLVRDLGNKEALKLSFFYDDEEVLLNSNSARNVKMKIVDGKYIFDVFERHLKKEREFENRLRKYDVSLHNTFFYLKGIKTLYDYIEFLGNFKSENNDFKIKQLFNTDKKYVVEKVFISFKIRKRIDWFDLYGIVRVGEFEVPFTRIRKNIMTGNREYVLPDNSIVILPEEWFTIYSDIIKLGSVSKDEALTFKYSQIGLMDDINCHVEGLDALNFVMPDVDEPVSSNLNATLRPYQRKGYSWLLALYKNNFGGCLADDMGLGKTLQFLSFFQHIYELQSPENSDWGFNTNEPTIFDLMEHNSSSQQDEKREDKATIRKPASLIVMPMSLIHNWINECKKFTPKLLHFAYVGSKRMLIKNLEQKFNNYNLIFTTYGTMRNDYELLSKYKFECVVLDESQTIKNPSSQLYKAAMELNASCFFSISGTPIENSLSDLWTQMNFINRDILGNLSYFKARFEYPIVRQKDEEQEQKLKNIIRPYILRRTKSEVAKDLPPKTEQTILCHMSEEHRKFYESEKSFCRNTILSLSQDSDKFIAIQALLRLRQISNHPALVYEGFEGESAKTDTIISNIESLKNEGHKVLVFSSFVKHLDIIEKGLSEIGIKYSKLTGKTTDRETKIAMFQNDKDVCCFLISLKAGGVGLNLTAADYVFIIDPWWNPAAEDQAMDRAHRIGQTRRTFVYRFIMADTIEEKIQKLQKEKKNLAANFVNNNNPFASISLDDLKKIME